MSIPVCLKYLPFLALVGLVSCSAPSSKGLETPAPKASESSKVTPVAATEPSSELAQGDTPSLQPGQYCFEAETDMLSGAIRLMVDQDEQVTGDSRATVHNEAEAYYTSYGQDLSGTLSGDQLTLDVKTWIEYDVQENSETWTVTPQTLDTGRNVYDAADCEAVQSYFTGPNGLEADDLTSDATVHTERVEFAPGKTSTVLENAVVRGERDVYLLNAQGGQMMKLSISSPEDNAVFDLVSPSGMILAVESMNEQVPLPETGDYQVIVGGTRGNAGYSLQVEIQ